MTLILVDCEGHGPAAGLNDDRAFEVGAVEFDTRVTFHGYGGTKETFEEFDRWLAKFPQPLVFVSDNPAYDWQFVNHYFHKFLGKNPFGHSARRIGDFYAGVMLNWRASGRDWKKHRRTPHDHNPVHDAEGNAQALEAIFLAIDIARTTGKQPLDVLIDIEKAAKHASDLNKTLGRLGALGAELEVKPR